jgi:hypothetical protein
MSSNSPRRWLERSPNLKDSARMLQPAFETHIDAG